MKSTKLNAEAQREKLGDCQYEVFRAFLKLQAIGVLLERQGEEHEGFTELHGLGLELIDLGDLLQEVWRNLDTVHFRFASNKPEGKSRKKAA